MDMDGLGGPTRRRNRRNTTVLPRTRRRNILTARRTRQIAMNRLRSPRRNRPGPSQTAIARAKRAYLAEKPRKAPSGYMLYVRDHWSSEGGVPGVTPVHLCREIAAEWRAMAQDERQPFNERAAAGQRRYRDNMRIWKSQRKWLNKPTTAYGLFVKDLWRANRANPRQFNDMTQHVRQRWAATSAQEKQRYENLRKSLFDRYTTEMNSLVASGTLNWDWRTEVYDAFDALSAQAQGTPEGEGMLPIFGGTTTQNQNQNQISAITTAAVNATAALINAAIPTMMDATGRALDAVNRALDTVDRAMEGVPSMDAAVPTNDAAVPDMDAQGVADLALDATVSAMDVAVLTEEEIVDTNDSDLEDDFDDAEDLEDEEVDALMN